MVNGRRLCYVSRNYKGRQGAGNKAKGDYEDILVQMGAHNLGLRRTYYKERPLKNGADNNSFPFQDHFCLKEGNYRG